MTDTGWFFILLFSLSLSACMLGPDFHAPATPVYHSYSDTKQDIPAEWWTLFHSTELNGLIRAGIANSPNMAAAQATLRVAKEAVNIQIGNSLFPAVSTQIGAERQRLSDETFGSSGSSVFSLYNASVNVSYTPDIFGAARRQIESLQAQAEFQEFELKATYLTLTSNIVTTAVTAASLQAQINATYALIRSQEEQLKIIKQQVHLGGASDADVYTQENLVAQTQATLPPLKQSFVQSQHALSVLVGQLPDEDQLPDFRLDKLTLPRKLPTSVPSQLVRQRPDVRAAEALLHSASAQIGVAVANLFPQFTLNGVYGWESFVPNHLFTHNTGLWSIGGSLLQPVFSGGALTAKKRQAIAAYDVALAQYRQTVLQAFQNVADSLRALEHDAAALKLQKAAESAAKKSLQLTKQQFQLGGVNYISLLTAEKTYQQAKINRIQAEAARYVDTAALFQALGGGWWTKS